MPPLAAEGLARFGNSLPEPNRRAACHPSSGSTDGCTCPHPTKPNLLRKRLGRHYNGFFAPIAALRPCSLFRLLKRKGPLTHLSDPGRFSLNQKSYTDQRTAEVRLAQKGLCEAAVDRKDVT